MRSDKEQPTSGNFTTCHHPLHGPRAASWAKLLCIRYVLENLNYTRIVYIDTDAIFADPKLNLHDFLQEVDCLEKSLVVPCNYPWEKTRIGADQGRDANAGLLIWRRSPLSLQIIESWWNFDAKNFNLKHDWEQMALNAHVLSNYSRDIQILPEVTMQEKPGQFVRHIPGPDAQSRRPRLLWELRKQNLDNKKYDRLIDHLRSNNLYLFGTKFP